VLQWLADLDTSLFLLVNGVAGSPVLDRVMVFVTTQDHWTPVLAGLWIALIAWGGKRGRMAAAMLAVAVALSDQLSSAVLKPLVERVRPCNALPENAVHLLVGRSRAFSFPSSHAANSAAAAAVLAWRWPRWAPLACAVAALVAISRVYVGLHYPGDVLGGAVLGVMCGRGAIWVVAASVRAFERSRGPREGAGISPAPQAPPRSSPPGDSGASGS
jgi:undecaprenyl-diphosphatase